MKVLIIGKNSFVGKNLYEFLGAGGKYDVSVVGSDNLNLLDEDTVNDYFDREYFDVIIDTAIYNPRVGFNKEPEKELEYDLRMFHNIAKKHE